jgi:uncharacterized integral membrane protein
MRTVEAFLNELQLGQYVQVFKDNGITMDNLDSLTDDDLKSIGIGVLGHRKSILKAAQMPAPAPAPAPTSAPTQASNQNFRNPMPDTYMWQSIFVTLFCCLPFGIIAIINAAAVSSAYNSGNEQLAYQKSQSAKSFVNWSIGIWFLLFFFYFVMMFAGLATL